MNDAFDALLEFGLRELLGRREASPDVAPSPWPGTRRRPVRSRHWPVAAAAAAVVAALALWPAAWAHSDGPLWIADGSTTFVAGTSLPPTAMVWHERGAATTVHTAAARAVCGPRTVLLHVTADACALLAGAITIHTTDPFRVHTDIADVVIRSGSSLRVQLTPDVPFPFPDPQDTDPMNLTNLLTRSHLRAALTVTVLVGHAELVQAQQRQPVAAGEQAQAQAMAQARADAGQATTLLLLVRQVPEEGTDERALMAMMAWKDAAEDLSRILIRSAAARAAVRSDLLQALQAPNVPEAARGTLISLADLDDDARALRATAAAFQARPELSTQDQRIALVERGEAGPSKLLLATIEQQKDLPSTAVAAAALAFAGDDSVRPTLQRWAKTPLADALADFQVLDARFATAAALHALGDKEPRLRLLAALERTAVAGWDSGDEQRQATARELAVRSAYFFGQGRPRLSHLGRRIGAYAAIEARGTDAESGRALFAELRAQ